MGELTSPDTASNAHRLHVVLSPSDELEPVDLKYGRSDACDSVGRSDVYLDERLFKIWEAQYTDVEPNLLVLVVLVTGDGPSIWSVDGLLEVCDALSDFGEA